jgi:hypothetical protein
MAAPAFAPRMIADYDRMPSYVDIPVEAHAIADALKARGIRISTTLHSFTHAETVKRLRSDLAGYAAEVAELLAMLPAEEG